MAVQLYEKCYKCPNVCKQRVQKYTESECKLYSARNVLSDDEFGVRGA
jgi:hypothetical protein